MDDREISGGPKVPDETQDISRDGARHQRQHLPSYFDTNPLIPPATTRADLHDSAVTRSAPYESSGSPAAIQEYPVLHTALYESAGPRADHESAATCAVITRSEIPHTALYASAVPCTAIHESIIPAVLPNESAVSQQVLYDQLGEEQGWGRREESQVLGQAQYIPDYDATNTMIQAGGPVPLIYSHYLQPQPQVPESVRFVETPPNNLKLSLFACLFCLSPFGIIAVIFSCLSMWNYDHGNIPAAREKGRIACGISLAIILLNIPTFIGILVWRSLQEPN